jgi:hypothetical protein
MKLGRWLLWGGLGMGASLCGAACRTPHLGDDYGLALRQAFAAQAERRTSQAPAGLDATDAHQAVTRHHNPDLASQTAPAAGSALPNPLSFLEGK